MRKKNTRLLAWAISAVLAVSALPAPIIPYAADTTPQAAEETPAPTPDTAGKEETSSAEKEEEAPEKKEKKNMSISMSAEYGDGTLSVADELDDDIFGNASYKVTEGSGVVSVSKNGTVQVKKAGNATVKAEAEDGTATIRIKVEKRDLGELDADDISWENTKKEEDGSDSFDIKGTVKDSAGLVGGDRITVTAKAKADSSEAGSWGSTLSGIQVKGDEDYTLSVSTDGPSLTITPAPAKDAEKEAGEEKENEAEKDSEEKKEDGPVSEEDKEKEESPSTDEKEKVEAVPSDEADKKPAVSTARQLKSPTPNNTTEGTDTGPDENSDNQGTEETAPGEVSVSGSYDNNSAKNGKYFNKERTLTLKADGDGFDPSLLVISVSADGREGTWSVAETSSKAPDGVSLEEADEAKGIYKIKFSGEDHAYTVSAQYDGKKASISGTAANEFVIDEKAPELSVEFFDMNGNKVEAAAGGTPSGYNTDSIQPVLSVKDTHFYAGGTKATVKATDADGNALGVYSGAGAPSSESWEENGDKNTFRMKAFEEDANYAVTVSVEDLAGNKASYDEHSVGIDKDAPKVTITVNAGNAKTYEDYAEECSFGTASAKEVNVTAKAKDSASGIKSIKYYVYTPEAGQEGSFAATSKDALEGLGWKDLPEGGISLKPDSQAVVYVRAEDKAGNITYANTRDAIVVDGTAPEAGLSIIGEEKEVYSEDVPVKVSAKEVPSGGTNSGLASVNVTVKSGTETTQEFNFEPGTIEDRVLEFEQEVTVSAEKNSSNDVVITVTVKDTAGNETSTEKRIAIDQKAPLITASILDSSIKNGHYTNETAQLDVTFTERNFDASKAFLNITVDGAAHTYSMEELADGKGEEAQIFLQEETDSQKDAEKKDLTDEREVSYTLHLGTEADADIDYSDIMFTCEDSSGNTAEGSPELAAVTVDKVAPVYAVTYKDGNSDVTDRIGTDEDAPYYAQEDVRVTLGVRDRNYDPSSAKARVTAVDHEGDDTGAYAKDNYEDITSGWVREQETSTLTLPAFTKDANYGVSMEAIDLAGNQAKAYPFHYFTIDKTAPEGKIRVSSADGDKSYTGYSSSAQFDTVSRDTISVNVSAKDATSGVASVRYLRYTPPENASGRFAALSLSQLKNASWEDWKGERHISPDGQAVIYARIADRAGNILYISTDGAMISDRTDPWKPEINISARTPSSGVYGGNVPASISVGDVVSGGTYSGLKEVRIEVLNGSEVTQSYVYHPGDKKDRVKTFGTGITVDASKNNSNYVTIRVTVQDHAGNTASAQKQLAIDTTAPSIEVTYDKNDPVNGRYYNTVRTATIVVRERNFDPSRANISVSPGARVSGWTIGQRAGSSDDNVNTCTIVYGADGDYTFTISVTDKAGNKKDYGRTDSFTIDMTKPVITVTYNTDRDGRFYNVARTATIHVREKNFRASEFEARIRAALEGSGIPAPSISGWSGSGDDHIATLTFNRDGDYSFELNYTDLASNKAAPYSHGLFTIDLTAPAVTVTGVENMSANRGKVAPIIQYMDINYDDAMVTIRLGGRRHEEKDVTGEFMRLTNGGQITLEDIARTAAEDDVYTLTVRVVDKAGNVTEKKVEFSVNRFGSNIYLDEKTAKAIEPHYLQEVKDVIFYEVNVDEIVKREFTIYRDGKVITIPETTVRISEEDDESGWNKYRYTIPGSVLEEEGSYEIIVSTEDRAGNKQENREKGAPAAFTIDRTPPSAVVTGIEDKEIYNESSRQFEVKVSDDQAIKSAEIVLDGQVKATFDAQHLEEGDGSINYVLEESRDWQTITVNACDMAGNTVSAKPVRVLVTTNTPTRIVESAAGQTLFLAAIFILLFGAIYIWKRMRDEKEKEEDDDDGTY